MTKITYLERPKENDAFHSVKNVVDYFSQPGNSPFVPTAVAHKRSVDRVKVSSQQQSSRNHVETRDDAPKRVMFHPNISVADSGEDLAFDISKIHNLRKQGNDDEQRDRGILTNADSVIASDQKADLTANEVYTGMSRRCSHLLQEENNTPESRLSYIKKKHRKKNRPKETPTSKVLHGDENQHMEGSTSDTVVTKPMSPKKYSLSKINKARSGPVPKSDDFFAELKGWHNAHALRDVGKPQEISIINEDKSMEAVAEDIENNKLNGTIEKAPADAKKTSPKKRELKKQMKKEAKRMSKQNKEEAGSVYSAVESMNEPSVVETMNEDGSMNARTIDVPKKKKKFWRNPLKSRRKQKSETSMISKSTGNDSNISSKSKLDSTDYPTLGITENPKKVPMKDPEDNFNKTLDKFLQLQLGMREDGSPTESDTEKSPKTAVLVETVTSIEDEERSTRLDPDGAKTEEDYPNETRNTDSSKKTEPFEEAGVEKSESKDQSSNTEVTQQVQTTEPMEIVEEVTKQEKNTSESEKLHEELKSEANAEPKDNEARLGEINTGLLKTEDKTTPPVSVVEVDQFDVDKYESVAYSESKNEGSGVEKLENKADEAVSDTKAGENNEEKSNPELVAEETQPQQDAKEGGENVLQSHCPCMPSPQQELHADNNNKDAEKQQESVADTPNNEVSWFELATGFFTGAAFTMTIAGESTETAGKTKEEMKKNSNDEVPPALASTLLQTPKSSNVEASTEPVATLMMPEPAQSETFDEKNSSVGTGRSNTFDESLLTEDSALAKVPFKAGSFDDSLITLEEGTKVTKIEPAEPTDRSRMDSLLDLTASHSFESRMADEGRQEKEATESRSCADSRRKDGGVESQPCADSRSRSKKDSATIHSKQSNSTAKKTKRSSKPTDIVVCKKEKKSANRTEDDQASIKATIFPKFSASTIFDFPQEDSVAPNKETVEKVSKQSKKKVAAKKTRARNKAETGATLFGRLEPLPDKKRKKKAKRKKNSLF